MSLELQNGLVYIGIFLAVFLVSTGLLYLKKKYNVTNEELQIVQTILKATDYVAKNISFKYLGNVSEVLKYTSEAIDFVVVNDGVDLNVRKALIENKVLEICKEKNVEISAELIEIVNTGVDYFIKEQKV